MLTQTFFSIIHLRYLLLKRLLFSKRSTAVWLPAFLFILSFFIFILYFLVTKGVMAAIISFVVDKDISVLPGILFGFLVFLVLVVTIYILIVGTKLKDALNYKNISFLPINYFIFYITEIVASLCDIWVLLSVPVFTGIIIGLGLFGSFLNVCLSLFLLILFVLIIGVFNQLFVCVIELFIKSKQHIWMKNIFFLLFLFFTMMLIMSPLFLIEKEPGELGIKMTQIFYVYKINLTPIGLVTDGLMKLIEGDIPAFLTFDLTLILCYIFLFIVAGYIISKYSLTKKYKPPKKIKSSINLLRYFDNALNIFSNNCCQFIAKEIVYLLRSARIKYFFVLGLLFISSQLISHASANRSNEIFIISWLAYPFLLLVMDSGYMYAYDDKAVKSNFFSPYHYKNIIWGKNISLLLLLLLFQLIFYVTIFFIWDSIFGIKVISASLALGCYLTFSNFITINYISITKPPKMKFESTFGRSSTNFGFVLLSILITVLPVIGCFILFQKSPYLLIISFMILCIISLILYSISLKPLSEKLIENQEYFIKQISG